MIFVSTGTFIRGYLSIKWDNNTFGTAAFDNVAVFFTFSIDILRFFYIFYIKYVRFLSLVSIYIYKRKGSNERQRFISRGRE